MEESDCKRFKSSINHSPHDSVDRRSLSGKMDYEHKVSDLCGSVASFAVSDSSGSRNSNDIGSNGPEDGNTEVPTSIISVCGWQIVLITKEST